MDVFDVRERLVEDYKAFTTSFVEVHDERLKQHVFDQLERGDQWPELGCPSTQPWRPLVASATSSEKDCSTPSVSASSGSRTTWTTRAPAP
jgi:hypothetical protein